MREISDPNNGSTTPHRTHIPFEKPPMSSRRKMSSTANPQTIARGMKIRKRKKLSQKVVATIVRLLQSGTTPSSRRRIPSVSPSRDEQRSVSDARRRAHLLRRRPPALRPRSSRASPPDGAPSSAGAHASSSAGGGRPPRRRSACRERGGEPDGG